MPRRMGDAPVVKRYVFETEQDARYVGDELVFTRPQLPQLTSFVASMMDGSSTVTPDATQDNNYSWRDTRWPASPTIQLRFDYTGATRVSFRQYPDGDADANIPVTRTETTYAEASFTPSRKHTRVVATATNVEGSVSLELHIFYWTPPTLTVSKTARQDGQPGGGNVETVRLLLTRGGSPLPPASSFSMSASDGSRVYDLTQHFRPTRDHPPPVLEDDIFLRRAVTGTFSNVTYTFRCSNTVPGATTRLNASASVTVGWP